MEISIREVLGVARSWSEFGATRTIKGRIAVEYEVSSRIKRERSCEIGFRCGPKELAVGRDSAVRVVPGIKVSGLEISNFGIL